MLPTIFTHLLGGVGLFLVGIILMSDGLKAAAGSALQRILERSTGTPVAAFLSGMSMTALVQSSHATTITTIGFVSAGLLTFSNAIGVIIGANVGTTSTGWIVSLLGFQLKIGALALPLIGVGALVRLLGHGRKAYLGMALAGFGLIFIGIDFLQEGMGGLAQRIDLSGYSHATLSGRAALVALGVVMTLLLQSSSAAVALTLAALHTQAVDLPQAAHLVIGQNLGTTITAGLVAIGASIPARRTAAAHVLFNVATGLLAFAAVGQLLALVDRIGNASGRADAAVQLALFHTMFNLAGALLFLPFTHPFASFVTRFLPDRGPHLTRHLDRSLLRIPAVAVEAAARALQEITAITLEAAAGLLGSGVMTRQEQEQLWAAQAAMAETSTFLGNVQMVDSGEEIYGRRLALLHAGDHVSRLLEACLESEQPIYGAEVQEEASRLAPELQEAIDWLRAGGGENETLVRRLAEASARHAEARRRQRAWLLEETAASRVHPDEAHRRLESMRWVDRVAYHTWRSLNHLASPAASPATETSVYVESEGQ